MVEIKLKHEEMTDKEIYKNLKVTHKLNPKLFMSPEKWKRERLVQLGKEGKVWSH